MLQKITDPAAITRECARIMSEASTVTVTTLDDGGAPCARGMFNLRRVEQFPKLAPLFQAHADDLLVYLTTNTSSEKVRQLRRDPRIALYYCLPGSVHGAMLGGIAELVQDADVRASLWHDGWEIYYPGGAQDPDHMVIRLRPRHVRGWLAGRYFDQSLEARA